MDLSILPQALSHWFSHWFSTTLIDLDQYQFGQRATVICFYIILSKIADIIIQRILLPISIRTSFDVDEHFVRFVRHPAVLSVFLLGILHATLLEPAFAPPWNTALPNLIKTLILVAWWISLIREITVMNENNSGWALRKFDRTRFYMLKNISRIILLFIGIIWGLIIWEVNLTLYSPQQVLSVSPLPWQPRIPWLTSSAALPCSLMLRIRWVIILSSEPENVVRSLSWAFAPPRSKPETT